MAKVKCYNKKHDITKLTKMEGPREHGECLLQNSLVNDGLVCFEFWIGRRMGDINIEVGLNIAVLLNMSKLV